MTHSHRNSILSVNLLQQKNTLKAVRACVCVCVRAPLTQGINRESLTEVSALIQPRFVPQ